MKTLPLDEVASRVDEIFDDAQSGSPVLLIRDGQIAKVERVEPPSFSGDPQVLEQMLLQAVRSEHKEWTSRELEDITRRVRERRGK